MARIISVSGFSANTNFKVEKIEKGEQRREERDFVLAGEADRINSEHNITPYHSSG